MDGRNVPLGYRVEIRKLAPRRGDSNGPLNLRAFLQIGFRDLLERTMNAEGLSGSPESPSIRAALQVLSNRVYFGEAVHNGTELLVSTVPIISRELWDKVRSIFADSPSKRQGRAGADTGLVMA